MFITLQVHERLSGFTALPFGMRRLQQSTDSHQIRPEDFTRYVEALKFTPLRERQPLGAQLASRATVIMTHLKSAQDGSIKAHPELTGKTLWMPSDDAMITAIQPHLKSRTPERLASRVPSRPGVGLLSRALKMLQYKVSGLHTSEQKGTILLLGDGKTLRIDGAHNSLLGPVLKSDLLAINVLDKLQQQWQENKGAGILFDSSALGEKLAKEAPDIFSKPSFDAIIGQLSAFGVLGKREPFKCSRRRRPKASRECQLKLQLAQEPAEVFPLAFPKKS